MSEFLPEKLNNMDKLRFEHQVNKPVDFHSGEKLEHAKFRSHQQVNTCASSLYQSNE